MVNNKLHFNCTFLAKGLTVGFVALIFGRSNLSLANSL